MYSSLREQLHSLRLSNLKAFKSGFQEHKSAVERMSREIVDDIEYRPNEREKKRDAVRQKYMADFYNDRSHLIRLSADVKPVVPPEGLDDMLQMQVDLNNQYRHLSKQMAATMSALNTSLLKPIRNLSEDGTEYGGDPTEARQSTNS